MTENISTNINNSYKYMYPELSAYDTDNDGELSVFELGNIQDSEGFELLNEDISIQTGLNNQIIETNKDTQISDLEEKLSNVRDEQGAVSSIWNGLKCLTGIGSSTNKCEQAIQDFKNNKITYEEADTIISEFSTKQKNSVNLIANIATGIAAVAVVASAVATGGVSLGVIAAGAAVGGATKAGIKFADRATNKVEGDALDGKQITKDALSGAVDGAVSVATMGIGSTAITSTTVANQTLKQTVIQGAKAGAKAGAISGAATGAADYSIEAAFEDDVDFNLKDLAVNTTITAAGGALAGGIMGGAASGIQYKSAEIKLNARMKEHPTLNKQTVAELSDRADELNKMYKQNIQTAKSQIEDEFGDLGSVETVSGRAKGEDSIFEKLAKKYSKGKLKSTSKADCLEAIGDAYGTRIQMKSLSIEDSKKLIENYLSEYDISYEQFVKYMNKDVSSLDSASIATLDEIQDSILNMLKKEQSQEVVNQLVDGIKNDRIIITELNNYGDRVSSYFTDDQLQEIAEAYYNKTGESLRIVSLEDFSKSKGCKIGMDDITEYTINSSDAVKDSGYASSQMNTKQILADGSYGNGELQIRGIDLNKFADVEHIPYDIKSGKIKIDDPKYSDICKIIKDMPEATYNKYNQFLTDTYHSLRLKELGIESTLPDISKVFSTDELSTEAMKLLDMQGLISVSKRGH